MKAKITSTIVHLWMLSLLPLTALSQFGYIANVPDLSQPIPNVICNPTNNACDPVSAANIIGYWETTVGHMNATGLSGTATLGEVASHIFYFMDTNNWGCANRNNGTIHAGSQGTYNDDIQPGFDDYVQWDAFNLACNTAASQHAGYPNCPPLNPPPPPPGLIPNKQAHMWIMATDYVQGYNLHTMQIDSGLPDIVVFSYWNLNPFYGSFSAAGTTVDFYGWGTQVNNSGSATPAGAPEESWNENTGSNGIGHAVTGVGYLTNYDPDGIGPAPQTDWIICHDNWPNTGVNIALPWQNWIATVTADPNQPILALSPGALRGSLTKEHTVHLKWMGGSDARIEKYVLSRKTNLSSAFQEIASRPASGEIEYSVFDKDIPAAAQQLHYRFEYFSQEGSMGYSNLVTLYTTTPTVKLYPNPATDYVDILSPAGIWPEHIQVIACDGKKVMTLTPNTDNPMRLSLKGLPEGLYYMVLQYPALQLTEQMVILD